MSVLFRGSLFFLVVIAGWACEPVSQKSGRAAQALRDLADRACQCKDAACARDVLADYEKAAVENKAMKRGGSKTLKKAVAAELAKVDARLLGCVKAAGLEPSELPSIGPTAQKTTKPSQAIDDLKALVAEACKCTDAACGNQTFPKVQDWGKKHNSVWAAPAQEAAMNALLEKEIRQLMGCLAESTGLTPMEISDRMQPAD